MSEQDDRPELDEEREVIWPRPRKDLSEESSEPWARLTDRPENEDDE